MRANALAKKGRRRKPDPKRALPAHIDQSQAKLYLPPEAHIWRRHSPGEWNCHLPDCRRISEAFGKHGSSELALRECLRRVWRQYLERSGLAEADCPIEGVFG